MFFFFKGVEENTKGMQNCLNLSPSFDQPLVRQARAVIIDADMKGLPGPKPRELLQIQACGRQSP